MSTSATFAAISASQAAIASAEASRAKAERCRHEVANFDSKTATLAESKSYADCIQTLHPDPLSGGALLAAKALFVFALVCGIVGCWRATRDSWNEWPDYVMFGLMWFFFGPVALLFVLGLFYGIYWVIA